MDSSQPSLGWFVRLLASDIPEVDLVVRTGDLPPKLVTFTRTGQFTLRTKAPVTWHTDRDGHADHIEVEPPDVANPFRKRLGNSLSWCYGSTVTFSDITLSIL